MLHLLKLHLPFETDSHCRLSQYLQAAWFTCQAACSVQPSQRIWLLHLLRFYAASKTQWWLQPLNPVTFKRLTTGRKAFSTAVSAYQNRGACGYAGDTMVALTPRHTYNASLGLVLRALAHMRAGGALLHAAEWRMYSAALQSNCICERMAAVATVSGDSEEVLLALHLSLVLCSRRHWNTVLHTTVKHATVHL